MNKKQQILVAVSEMSEREIDELWYYIPKHFKKNEKQKVCTHSMRYDMKTGGSTCTLCGWMS